MKLNRLFGVPAAALLLTGCASTEPPMDIGYAANDEAVPAAREASGARRRAAAPAAKMASAREAGSTSNFTAVKGRQVAFSATLRISSPDVAQALRNANEITREFGGYASLINDRACTLKIPVKTPKPPSTRWKRSAPSTRARSSPRT